MGEKGILVKVGENSGVRGVIICAVYIFSGKVSDVRRGKGSIEAV